MRKKEEKREVVNVFSGLGSLFGGVTDLLKQLDEMGKTAGKGSFGPEEMKVDYQFNVRTLGTGKHGLSLRPGGLARTAQPERIGTVTKPRKRETKAAKNQFAVLDKGSYVFVFLELPEVKSKKDIEVKPKGNTIEIFIKTPEGRQKKIMKLTDDLKVKDVKNIAFDKGVLGVKLSKQKSKGGKK